MEVQAYRNTILHNPVLGRAVGQSRVWLPKREFLKDVRNSWRKAASLNQAQLVDSRALYSRLGGEVTAFLQEKWQRIIGILDSIRECDKFKKQWKLEDRFLPIGAPELIASTIQPIVGSGGPEEFCYSPTAVTPVLLSSDTTFSPQPNQCAKKKSKE